MLQHSFFVFQIPTPNLHSVGCYVVGTDVHFQRQHPIRAWETMRNHTMLWLTLLLTSFQMSSLRGVWHPSILEVGFLVPGVLLLPQLSSMFYWCPKEPRLEVSPSGVSGSNFSSWIWSNLGLKGPSGRFFWKRNKWSRWEWGILV